MDDFLRPITVGARSTFITARAAARHMVQQGSGVILMVTSGSGEAWTPPARQDERGYRALYEEHVLQANEGCDLDFLRGRSAVIMDAVTYL